MAHKLRRRKVDSSTEKRILTALIVSTQFIQEIQDVVNLDYFTNSFIRKAAGWCLDFFQNYETAPFDHIQDIFRNHRKELKDDEADLIEKLLTDISKKYELDQGLNVPYMVDQALFFFKKRELEITNGNISILLDRNDIDGAEAQINSFAKISRVASGLIDPFDIKHVDEVFAHQERMFTFPGELGRFLCGFDREWLVEVTAPFKRGKTFALQELAVAALQQRLKTVFFSLEMTKVASNKRLYKRLLGAAEEEGGKAVYPCFDCEYNQDGSCNKPKRVNKLPLIKGSGKPLFSPNMRYRPCTVCRYEDPKEYQVAWWFELLERPAFNKSVVGTHIAVMAKVYGNNYRFKQYPKFSANTSDIRKDLDILERVDNFIPDVIIVDHALILKPEEGSATSGIEQLDTTWKSLAQLAGERHALVATASQTTRAAMEKKQVKSTDTAQWIGAIGHIDVAWSLNQTPEEKRAGVIRYSKLVHRHDDFDEDAVCIVLQNLNYGQTYLDAYTPLIGQF